MRSYSHPDRDSLLAEVEEALCAGDLDRAQRTNLLLLEAEPNDPDGLVFQARIFAAKGAGEWASNILSSLLTFDGIGVDAVRPVADALELPLVEDREYGHIWDRWNRRRNMGELKRFSTVALLCRGKVLDIGCGNGELTYFIASFGHDVEGVDPDPEGVKLSSHFLDRLFPDRVTLHEGDGAAPPTPRNSYDTVVISEVIEHVPDCRPILEAAVASLKPGGRLIVSTPDRTLLPDREHIRYFSRTSLAALLANVCGVEPTYVPFERYADRFPTSHLLFHVDLPGEARFEPLTSIEVSEPPLVSYIVPTYNRADMVTEAVEGLLGQTWPNVEVIVHNDGSTDHTREALARFGDRIVYQEGANAGKPLAINASLPRCRGDFIAVFDDDDLPFPDKTAVAMSGFRKYPNVGLVGTSGVFQMSDGTIETVNDNEEHVGDFLRKMLLEHFCFLTPTMVVRREVQETVGGYDPAFKISEDVDMMLRIVERYDAVHLEVPTMLVRRHSALRGDQTMQYCPEETSIRMLPYIQAIHRRGRSIPLERVAPELADKPEASPERVAVLFDRLRSMIRLRMVTEALEDLVAIVKITSALGMRLPRNAIMAEVNQLVEMIVADHDGEAGDILKSIIPHLEPLLE